MQALTSYRIGPQAFFIFHLNFRIDDEHGVHDTNIISWLMKQSRTSGTALMSTSCLPLLCPVVGKAPVLTSRPKQKLPTPSQQALFTLLKQRHERYRTQKESIAADPSAAHDWGKQTVHVYPSATSLMQYDAGYGAPYSPSGSLHKRTSATNLFSDLGKWHNIASSPGNKAVGGSPGTEQCY